MLDLYRVSRLEPWPDDLPEDAVHVGSIDLHDFQDCKDLLSPCFAAVGIDVSYFDDWIVGGPQLDVVLACLTEVIVDRSTPGYRAFVEFVGSLKRVQGFTLLAVCD